LKPTAKELSAFIIDRVRDVANETGLATHQAFPRWFAEMYFSHPEQMVHSDGPGDGKIDLFFRTVTGTQVTYHVVNSKFTEACNQRAPVSFYDEVASFYRLFAEPRGRGVFLQKKVHRDLRTLYQQLFAAFDEGKAKLLFLTNHLTNDGQLARVSSLPVETLHLEELVQHVLDDLDGAMPRTPELTLQRINNFLSPRVDEVGIATAIVFARLVDFVAYMENDPYDLLFARNVRVSQGSTTINRAITKTFAEHPEQFAYSNNGVTLLCEGMNHDPGRQELRLVNPRVVNGCQTLHSVRAAMRQCDHLGPRYFAEARVMVRIVSSPPAKGSDAPEKAAEKKEIINRISIRSNQQNPIKKWNLVANDDFQMELARRFRREGLFYERRDGEWRSRRAQLKSVGIEAGPDIKWLMARIACYHWKSRRLGPALAKGNVGELFEGDAYDLLRRDTTAELAYQLYLLGDMVAGSLYALGQRAQRYENARRHIDLVVLSLVCRAVGEAGAAWRRGDWTAMLQEQWNSWDDVSKSWRDLTRAAADVVLVRYKRTAVRVKRQEGEDLTLKNFVRRQSEMSAILMSRIQGQLKRMARVTLETS
jgi:hypothetical protein